MDYFFNFDKMQYVKGEKPQGCILCLIRDGNRNVVDLKVHETDLFVVCVNLYPYNPGHLMIFPKRHLLDIRDYNEEESREIHSLTRTFLSVLDETHSPAAYNIGYNMGPSAGASIAHLHLHIIPRYPREIGIADLLAGKRVLVEHPEKTMERIKSHILETDS